MRKNSIILNMNTISSNWLIHQLLNFIFYKIASMRGSMCCAVDDEHLYRLKTRFSRRAKLKTQVLVHFFNALCKVRNCQPLVFHCPKRSVMYCRQGVQGAGSGVCPCKSSAEEATSRRRWGRKRTTEKPQEKGWQGDVGAQLKWGGTQWFRRQHVRPLSMWVDYECLSIPKINITARDCPVYCLNTGVWRYWPCCPEC